MTVRIKSKILRFVSIVLIIAILMQLIVQVSVSAAVSPSVITIAPVTQADWDQAYIDGVPSGDKTYFHKELQIHIIDIYNLKGFKMSMEEEIAHGALSGNDGYADLLLPNVGTPSTTYIWDVKPASTWYKSNKLSKAIKQLNNYVLQYSNNTGKPCCTGDKFFDDIQNGVHYIRTTKGVKYKITYQNAHNGLIFYRFDREGNDEDKKQEQEQEQEQEHLNPVPIPDRDSDPVPDPSLDSNPEISPEYQEAVRIAIYVCSCFTVGMAVLEQYSPHIVDHFITTCTAFLNRAIDLTTFKMLIGGFGGFLAYSNLSTVAAAYFEEQGYDDLTEEEMEKMKQEYIESGSAPAPIDPLVIDLGEPGIELTTVKKGVHFDLDNNGFAELTSWIGTEDGFLVLDRNGNGKIDNGNELFGDQVTLKNGEKSSSGFEALEEFDENKDGLIDENDSEFANLKVWIDSNHNGISESNELKNLSALGIVSIGLNFMESNVTDAETGTLIARTAVVTFSGAKTTDISEFQFPVDKTNTLHISDDDIVATIGNIPDITKAISKDKTGELAALYNEFDSTNSIAVKRSCLKKILYFITGANNIPANSRGNNIDARDLHVIECFMGTDFVGSDGGSSPNANAASILKSMYSELENLYFCILNHKSQSGSYMKNIFVYTREDGRKTVNLVLFNTLVQNMIGEGEDVDLMLYGAATYLKAYDSANGTSTFDEFSEYYSSVNSHFAIIMGMANCANIYWGTQSNDKINGTNNNDFIFGDAGNDKIYAGTGNNYIDGGEGDDYLESGSGDDVYICGKGLGSDTIYDNGGANVIKLKNLKPTDMTVYYPSTSNDAVLTIIETGETLTIKNFRSSPYWRSFTMEFDDGTVMKLSDEGSPFLNVVSKHTDERVITFYPNSTIRTLEGA